MAKAKKSKQLSFSIRNRVGLLSEISTAITNAKVNMYAICAYGMEGKAYFMLVTDSNAKTKKPSALWELMSRKTMLFRWSCSIRRVNYRRLQRR